MPRAPQPPGHARTSSTMAASSSQQQQQQQQQQNPQLHPDDPENQNNNGASNNVHHVTTTAPLATAKKKQHQHLLMTQLRNAIYETHQAPPDGTTEEMVLERRAQLQYLLDNLEKQYQQSKDEALQSYNDRWLSAFERQRKREQQMLEDNQRRTEASLNQANEFGNQRQAMIRAKNQARLDRTQECENHLFARLVQRTNDLDKSSKRKQAVYDEIQHRREQEGLEHLRRQIESERKCEEMLRRKQERDEEERSRKEAQAAARRRAADERLEELQLKRQREAQERREHASDAYKNATRKKYSVVLRPKPHLEEIENDYEARYKRQTEAEKERADLVKRIKEESQQIYKATVGYRHEKNRQMQQENMDKQLREHEQACIKLQQKIRDDALETKRKLAERDADNLMRLQLKDEEVSLHRQRHADTVHNYQDTTKRRVYDRWNRQLEHVSQELGVELPKGGGGGGRASSASRQSPASASGGGGGRQFAAGSGAAAAAAGRRNSSPLGNGQQQQESGGGLDHHSSTFLTQGGRETPQGKLGSALG